MVRGRDERKKDKRGKAPQSTSNTNTGEAYRNRETRREQGDGEEARMKIETRNLPPAAAARRLQGGATRRSSSLIFSPSLSPSLHTLTSLFHLFHATRAAHPSFLPLT